MTKGLVILLHGVGSNGTDMLSLASLWRNALPDVVFEAPNAPQRFDQGGHGYQWFSIAGVTSANRSERIASARADFDATMNALIDKHGYMGQLSKVVFVGFSQGAFMGLDAVASGRYPIAGLVAFSGRLALPLPLTPALATPVLLLHGTDDLVVPSQESADAARVLKAAGMTVQSHFFPGLGHTISMEGATLAADFIAHALP